MTKKFSDTTPADARLALSVPASADERTSTTLLTDAELAHVVGGGSKAGVSSGSGVRWLQ